MAVRSSLQCVKRSAGTPYPELESGMRCGRRKKWRLTTRPSFPGPQRALGLTRDCMEGGSHMTRTFRRAALISAALAVTGVAGAQAQSFPAKPIRVVVPFAPGGTSDILARLIGAKLNESLGQQVIVDNRPGASGNIGTELVAKSPPDGYTLVLMDVGNLSISPSIFPKLPFDIIKDLSPVTVVSYSPHLLCVHPSVPAGTVKQLIALAKSRSEERRVGKECRSRWSSDHDKRKDETI